MKRTPLDDNCLVIAVVNSYCRYPDTLLPSTITVQRALFRRRREFPAEAGHYHLYITNSCPFSSRVLAARNLKGLQDVIELSVAHPIVQKTKPDDPTDTHFGWTFADPKTTPSTTAVNDKTYPTEGCIPNTVNNARRICDLYEMVDKTPHRYTMPVLWDKKKQTIVSNESADILRMLNSGFRDLVPSNVELVPAELEEELNAANNGIVAKADAGLFGVAFAADEDTKKAAEERGRAALEKLNEILATKHYLVGDAITEADVRMFHTLIQIDAFATKENQKNLTKHANIVEYVRGLYQTPALKATVNWDHLKVAVVSKFQDGSEAHGPYIDYDVPHSRGNL